jgi:hypothetical protein
MNRVRSLFVALLLPACGAEVISAAPATPAAPVAPRAPEGPLAACVAPRADGSVLAWVGGADVRALDARGELRTLDAAESADDDAVTQLETSDDGYLAVARHRRTTPPGARITYALLGPDGGARWRRAQSVTYTSSPFRSTMSLRNLMVSSGGVVVANHASFDTMSRPSVEWLAPDGTSRWLEGATATRGADEAGRVLVRRSADAASDPRWWDPRRDVAEALPAHEGAQQEAFAVGPYTVSYTLGAAGASIVSRRGARVDRLALPFATTDGSQFLSTRDEGWMLLGQRAGDGSVVRVDLAGGRVETLAVQYPPGLRAVGFYGGPGLDADGALLAVLRDDDWARLYRSEDGARWTPIGRPVSGTLGVMVSSRAGTYVIQAHSDLYGGESWPDTVRDEPDGLRGYSLQAVRPETGREMVVRAGEDTRLSPVGEGLAVASTGRCAAWVEVTGEASTLRVVNLAAGGELRVALPRRDYARHLVWF